ISRGACRVVENGQARAMDVYLLHKKSRLRTTLQSIMPGLRWKPWIPTCENEGASHSLVDIHAMQIKTYLDNQPEGRSKVPTREIRQVLSIDNTVQRYRKAFDRAVDKVCDSGYWIRHGHSLLRGGLIFS